MTGICDTLHRVCNGVLNLSWAQTDGPIDSLQGRIIRTVAGAFTLGTFAAKYCLAASSLNQISSIGVGGAVVIAGGSAIRGDRKLLQALWYGAGAVLVFDVILLSGVKTAFVLGSALGGSLLGRVVQVGAGALVSGGVTSIFNRLGNRFFPSTAFGRIDSAFSR